MKLTYRPIDTWPGELTTDRKPSQFTGDWRSTLEVLEREVGHLTDTDHRYYHPSAVLQLALPEHAIRQDGQIRSGAKPPEHPGVILSIDGRDGPLRFACDRFESSWKGTRAEAWRHNVRAIAFGLEALRKVERYGLGRGTEQYVGFQALPPAGGTGIAMPAAGPATTMTLDQAAQLLFAEGKTVIDSTNPFEATDLLASPELASSYYRSAAMRHHPDAGGDPAIFRRLTEARDLLLAHGARQ